MESRTALGEVRQTLLKGHMGSGVTELCDEVEMFTEISHGVQTCRQYISKLRR